jgi:hypothetical protein
MKRLPSLSLVVVLLGVLAGCASAPAAETAAAPRRQANLITYEEIQSRAQARDAFDAIQALRPNWLRPRGQQSLSDPTAGTVVVYLDGARFGGPDALRQVAVQNILSAQYLNAGDATARFGTGHTGGVILIVSRRG